MEEERQLEVRQSESEDFLILEDGDFQRKKSDSKMVYVIKIKNSINLAFMQKLWIAFITLHLFVVPTILGLVLGEVMTYADVLDKSSGHEEIKHHIVMACLAASIFVGVPFHLLAMDELEEVLHQAEMSVISRDAAIQTDVEDYEFVFETHDGERDSSPEQPAN